MSHETGDAPLQREISALCSQLGRLTAQVAALAEAITPVAPGVKNGGPIVKINVGGTVFTARRSTLCTVPGSFFEALLSGRFQYETDADGLLFVDRSPKQFEHVLAWLRDPWSPAAAALPIGDAVFRHEVAYYGLAHAMFGGQLLYVLGGRAEFDFEEYDRALLTSIECYFPRQHRWLVLPTAMPQTRLNASVAVLNGDIYMLGGHDGENSLASVVAFNVAQQTWKELAPLSSARQSLRAVVLDNSIYAIGGDPAGEDDTSAVVERYDATTNTWTAVAALHIPRSKHVAAVFKGRIYVFGGCENLEDEDDEKKVECYDPAINAWTILPGHCTPRRESAYAVVGSKIFVCGGSNIDSLAISSAEMYDPDNNTWTQVAPMPTPRAGMTCAVVDNKVYVTGGIDAKCEEVNLVDIYDPASDEWTRGEDMNNKRGGHVTAAV